MIPALLLAAALVGPPAPERHFSPTRDLDAPFAALVILDGISTETMLQADCHEVNPLPGMRSHLGRLAWGAFWVVAVSWAEYWLETHEHRGWARALRWGLRGQETFLSVHNFKLATE